jgi:hypothetical protein
MVARLPFIVLVACSAPSKQPSQSGGPEIVDTAEFSLPAPAGYRNLTASYQAQDPAIRASFAGKDARGEDTVIVLQRAPIPSWVTERCEERATMTVQSAPNDQRAKLDSFAVVDWAGAKACEYSFSSPYGGPRTITERLDPADPEADGWMLLCQHNNEPSAAAECRATRARLALKKQAK